MTANQTVTTNLRLPYADWLQVKTIAAETGMSINEYIRSLISGLSNIRALTDRWDHPATSKSTIWNLPALAKGKNKPMGSSPDDGAIYG